MKLRGKIIFSLIMATLLGVFMTITATLLHGGNAVHILISFLIAEVSGFVISFFIPLQRISAWFASLFRIRGRIPSILVGNFLSNFVMTSLMAVIMTMYGVDFNFSIYLFALLEDTPVMLAVSYVVSAVGLILLSGRKKPETDSCSAQNGGKTDC